MRPCNLNPPLLGHPLVLSTPANTGFSVGRDMQPCRNAARLNPSQGMTSVGHKPEGTAFVFHASARWVVR